MNRQQRIVALTVACALMMQNIDSTILGTALVTIGRDFGADPVRMHLALTAYLVSIAVFMPLSGWFADRFGARDVFRAAVVIFTLGSVGCAFAPNLESMILARVVQGLGGSMLTPVARLALLRAVPKAQLVNATAWVSIPALLGPLIGAPLGGFIITYFPWQWIFWINLPIGVLGFVLATRYFSDVRENDVPHVDLWGLALLGSGLAAIVFGLDSSRDSLLPIWGNGLLVVAGALILTAYVRHSRRVPAPILDLSLLRLRTFSVGVIGGSIFRLGIGALPFLLPLTLQTAFGFDPLASGLTTFGAAAGAMFMKTLVSPVLRRFGFRNTLIWNAVLAAVFVAACALFTPAWPVWLIFLVLVVGGVFRSLQFTAVNTIVYAELSEAQMSRATSLSGVAQQLSLSAGISLAALTLDLSRLGGLDVAEGGYAVAFGLLGLILLASIQQSVRLPADAGDEMAQRLLPRPKP